MTSHDPLKDEGKPPATVENERFFDFGPFRLDRRERLLFRDGAAVALAPKAVDLLLALTDEPGALVLKEELIAKVWPDVVVDESNLSQNIFLLRKALDDGGGRWIATVPRRGYRFVGEVKTGSAVRDSIVAPAIAPSQDSALVPGPEVPRARWLRVGVVVAVLVLVGVTLAAWLLRSRDPIPNAPNAAIRSIAVLPFQPVDDAQKDRILQLGIADSVINKLSQLSAVAVSPTHAVTPFLDGHVEALAAGRELGVDSVVEGSIQRKGPRIRCSVRLLRVSDGRALWADHYDEDAADVFVLEDHIAERVATALDIHLGPGERRGLARRYTENHEAYDLFLQGRLAWERFDSEGREASLRYYQAALQRDPRYALAWGGIAKTYSVMAIYGPLSPDEGNARAKEAAYRALAIDPQIAEAHIALAACAIFRDRNWTLAEEEIRRALEIDPACDAHTLRGYLLQARGKPEEALYEMRRERDLDPLWRIPKNDCVLALFLARRYDEAISEGSQLLALDPGDKFVRYFVGRSMLAKGVIPEGIADPSADPSYRDSQFALHELATIAWKRGDHRGALAYIARMETLRTTGRTNFTIATFYAEIGDSDNAFRALDAAARQQYPFLYQMRTDPSFDSIRSDPRYAPLLAKLNLAPTPPELGSSSPRT